VVAVFMMMYGHNEKELQNNELLINFFGDADRGRHLLRYEDFMPEAAPQGSKLDSNRHCSYSESNEIKSCDNSDGFDEDSCHQNDLSESDDFLKVHHSTTVARLVKDVIRYVSDDEGEDGTIDVSEAEEYDTEDDDMYILDQLDEVGFKFDELETLGCEKLQREDLDVA